MDRAHLPIRVWWAPWRRHCSCGAHRWPCPDTLPGKPPPPAYWLSLRNTKAHWIDELADPPHNSGQPDGTADDDPTGDPLPRGSSNTSVHRPSRTRRRAGGG